MSVLSVILEYKWIILFYLAIVLFIYLFRKRFQFQAKFIAMYRTKIGLKLMDKIGVRHSELVKVIGYTGIGIGYVGMVVILGFIVLGIYQLLFVPSAPPVLAPVIPGVPIPGSPILVPFWYGIISLFVVVTIHEFSHGVVARAHGIPVLNSGIVFFGPLIGAFVEPDEKKLNKEKDVVKYSVFAAGPYSNIILALIVILLVSFVTGPVVAKMYEPGGVIIGGFQDAKDIEAGGRLYGLEKGVVVIGIDNYTVQESTNITTALASKKPGDKITVYTLDSQASVTLASNPANESLPYIGIQSIDTYVKPRKGFDNGFVTAIKTPLLWLVGNPYGLGGASAGLLAWIFMLSLGLGLANLLPVGPVDGGRMILESLQKIWGDVLGKKIWFKTTLVMVIIIVILIFVPIIKALL
jgi:membrane-associated protease RseP (regulator of RpoE activity)